MRRFFVIAMLFGVISSPAVAREIAGVEIDERITQADGTELQLNGAGIRSKFVVKVYVAMLYLSNPSNDRDQVISDPGAKRLIMHFLYKEVDKDALVEAWNDGFTGNGTAEQLERLKSEIAQFNGLFDTVKKGDRIVLDYVPGKGTTVTINATEKGTIGGKEFNDLLLAIWLGDKPVAEKLRKALLGS